MGYGEIFHRENVNFPCNEFEDYENYINMDTISRTSHCCPDNDNGNQQTIPDKYLTYPLFKEEMAGHPWLSPGKTNLQESCGIVSGWYDVTDFPYHRGGSYKPDNAEIGDVFTDMEQVLPSDDNIWIKGSQVNLSSSLNANHGGGYQYHLCLMDENGIVTEDCFQRTPLKPTGDSYIEYGPISRQILQEDNVPPLSDVHFSTYLVSEGVFPTGSEWIQIPIPPCNTIYRWWCRSTRMERNLHTIL